MAWIQQVEKTHVALADLEVSDKRWDDLDVVLAAAIVKVVNNTLLRGIMIHQETQAQQGKLLQGRAALWYVYRQYGFSAAATHAIDRQSLMNLKFTGDLEGFLQAWDICILATSIVPSPDLLHSLFEPKLRACKQLQQAFAVLDGNDLLANAEQLEFIYQSACRVVENMKAERTRQELM